uniref:Protein-S-isoprenylcysteine O-methyltransferase n=1 Tax=Haptolina brevifila TaxID=156173 RepID=A0A7S2C155_9EUKA
MVAAWGNDGRPPWLPIWVPSVEAIKEPFKNVMPNAMSNMQKPGKSKKELAIELTLVVIQFTGILLCILGLPCGAPPWFLAQIAGVALVAVGAFYFVAAPATLGTKLTFLPTPTTGFELVTEGVFDHCRHPQYFGVLAFCIGLSLVTLSAERLLWTVVVWLVLDKKADIEEMYLAEVHPDIYPAYVASKPKFIPGRLVTGRLESYSELDEEKIAE